MTERTPPQRCYRDRDNGVRYIRNAHRHDCTDTDCRGCTPCPEPRHCSGKQTCTWHVAAGTLTCGRCLATTRAELRKIVALAQLLPIQAISDGLQSEAANLAGPAADVEAWTWRKIAAKQGRAWHASLTEDEDEHHPQTVLTRWETMIREEYHHEPPPASTITTASTYLDQQLHRIANDPSQDFAQLTAELKKCRQHLEAVIHNNDQTDHGAPCPTCTEAGRVVRLERKWAHYCDREDCRRIHFTDDTSDIWQCPREPEHWWTQQGYADLLEQRRHAPTAKA